MRRIVTLEHLESGRRMEVEFHVFEEAGHWVGKLRQTDAQEADVKAPTFYGQTAEQAERQLRKLFYKDYDVVEERMAEE